jgi:DNA-binding NtrC family response regulator
MRGTLLVIDDDAASRRLVSAIFAAEGLVVVEADGGEAGLRAVEGYRPDVVLLDMQMPTISGLAVLEALAKAAPGLPVIMVTADREVKSAVQATRLGAYDYLTKPIDHDEIIGTVHRALERTRLRAEVEELRGRLGEGGGLAVEMGTTPQVREVVEQVSTVAASDLTVLVLGETGTGKELVAQALHRQSRRYRRPFVALDCGAIPDALLESELFGHERGAFTGAERKRQGRFELAQGGTLFLDEIGNLPLPLQSKLLRVLESRQLTSVGGAKSTTMDVRFVAATNDDLQARVAKGLFRADLYYRLAQYTIVLPALRDRRDDVAYLARRFLEEANVELRRPPRAIAPEALELLERHAWPGNVRELRNVMRQAALRSEELVLGQELFQTMLAKGRLSSPSGVPAPAGSSLREIAEAALAVAEKQAIGDTLRSTHGNKSQAARLLQTDYKTLHLKMKRLGLRARDYER